VNQIFIVSIPVTLVSLVFFLSFLKFQLVMLFYLFMLFMLQTKAPIEESHKQIWAGRIKGSGKHDKFPWDS
jgi:hypothetical protein